jgi:hypothetical protein
MGTLRLDSLQRLLTTLASKTTTENR